MKLNILNPQDLSDWDSMLLRAPGGSFFHSSAWAKVLSESYDYTPLYFAVIEEGGLRALVPVMEVSSSFTGKRGVSLPFTDSCDPILDGNVSFHDLFNQIVEFGKARGWKYVELRGGEKYLRGQESRARSHDSRLGPDGFLPVPPSSGLMPCGDSDNDQRVINKELLTPVSPATSAESNGRHHLDSHSCVLSPKNVSSNQQPATCNSSFVPFVTYIGHTLDLTKGEKALYSGLRDSTRRNVKKAEKEKVEVRVEKTREAMGEFCRLNRLTRREHGLPPQPYRFFEKVHRDIISKESGFIALAYFQGKAIAGSVFFHFGDQAIYKYGASDKTYQHFRANNLVMWEGIRWFAERGFKSFCLGRTELENEGLRQFKNGWGPVERQIKYFRYELRKSAFVLGKGKGEPAYACLFRATPIPVLNVIGSLLYRHMG